MARISIRQQLALLRSKFRNLNADYAMFKRAAKSVISQEQYDKIIDIVKENAKCQK